MHSETKVALGMKPVTITLGGETACYLLLALKEEIAHGQLSETGVQVYEEVVAAIIAGIDASSAH